MKLKIILKVFAVACLLVTLISCHKKEITLPNENLKQLFGEWIWKESVGGVGGKTITPFIIGYQQKLEFNEKGIMRDYHDDKLFQKIKFSVKEYDFASDTLYRLEFNTENISTGQVPIDEYITFSGDGNELYLNEDCPDCYFKTYVKKK